MPTQKNKRAAEAQPEKPDRSKRTKDISVRVAPEETKVVENPPNTRRRGGRPKKDGDVDSVPEEKVVQPRSPRGVRKGAQTGAPEIQGDPVEEDSPMPQSPPHMHHYKDSGACGMSDTIMEAVVKVFCIHCEPNFSLPWQRKRQYSSSSSGFILPNRRILTNAHCVDYHTQVKVKKRGSEKKYMATVMSVGTECDIAMLTVEEDDFWSGVAPVQFGDLPHLQDAVTVVGYPIGGDTISVTSGVVSRIEVTSYVHGAAELLAIQIDAAINSGNSGGPAVNDKGHCVGIAFQSLRHEDAENIGYIIPTPVIQHFLTDYDKNKTFTGFPCLGIEFQKMENPDMRLMLTNKEEHKGVLIRRVEPTSQAKEVMSQNNVLVSFDKHEIANDGTVEFRKGERISFTYLVSRRFSGETADVTLLRDGKMVEAKVVIQAPVRLIPVHTKNEPPSYFIIAGLVFTPVTAPYLRSEYGKEYDFDAPVKLLDKMMHTMVDSVGQQVVVLAQVLACAATQGYEEIMNTQVTGFNNQKIKNLQELVSLVDTCKDEYLSFELDYHQKVVLRTERAREATTAILATHGIALDRSPDLMLANGNASGSH